MKALLLSLALILAGCAGHVGESEETENDLPPGACLFDEQCPTEQICIGVSKMPHGVCVEPE